MKEISFPELGYFTKAEVTKLTKALNGKTYMGFFVKSGDFAGNHTLFVETDYDASEAEIRSTFLSLAFHELARRS